MNRKEVYIMKKININEDNNRGVVRKLTRKQVIKFVTSIVTIAAMGITLSTASAISMPSATTEDIDAKLETVTTAVVTTEDELVVTGTTETSTTSTTSTSITTTSTTGTASSTSSLTTSVTTDTTTEATKTTTEVEETTAIVEEEDVQDTEPAREYIVYKPSTHYVHKNTCRWFDSTCKEIDSTEGLECRRCSECKPDIEIITEYVVPTPPATVVNTSEHAALNYVTEDERVYLCNVVGSEYGSDWVSLYDKACVVATVMNRYYDGGWQGYGRANTIYNVITAPGQYNPAYAVNYYRYNVTESCIQAVDYYFENQDQFPHYTSFWGDGRYNHFS